ncbi:DMT family transporter [Glaciimonas immobilis]|uniref:Drug/metabolite transporter (DMT)-like permease n=1 Tax=Glaciimonas immobilis TaxID=728004 RepID=A0A840RWM6_9BURK|nr:DMT family transporter [Glaciimonas immobilis]KAF3998365.1 EamA family transporter [Glaciimonas immobilis]MBB5201993.1 drug/metabolite transporter (DMT)-like permease [Glaciimonas immobilis]
MHKGVIYAFLAAALFGASTPFAKLLVGQMAPVMAAGLLYLGSGVGLLAWYALRSIATYGREKRTDGLKGRDLPWLAGAILFGGVAGPVLLLVGLMHTPASSASLLLNMEGVLTALLAWFVFRENFDRRIFLGMIFIVSAGILLSGQLGSELGTPWGALAIIAACLCWAIDNNLTRKVSGSDAVQVAGIKGLVAGLVNLSIAFSLGYAVPEARSILSAGIVGFCGYGLSLVMFVLALRHLGAARTGAYFSAAPFVGAIMSLWMLGDIPGNVFWISAVLMAIGIWLHVTERHGHAHTHLPMQHPHSHLHYHDSHHQHTHDFPWDGEEPHNHAHQQQHLVHTHAHFPDLHHRHRH